MILIEDQLMLFIFYLLKRKALTCIMLVKFVRLLKTRLYLQMKDPYRHFKRPNHSISLISFRPVEQLLFYDNYIKIYKNILR